MTSLAEEFEEQLKGETIDKLRTGFKIAMGRGDFHIAYAYVKFAKKLGL